jgi:hypothetical protein
VTMSSAMIATASLAGMPDLDPVVSIPFIA